MLSKVDFPAPFSPLNAQCSPFITVKFKSFRMVRSPYLIFTSLKSITCWVPGSASVFVSGFNPYLKQLVANEQPDIIVGTSMGGMYAHQMFGFKRICVNPALNMSTMSKVLKTGTYKFLNGRKDNQKEFKITKDIIQHFNQMERQQFKGLTDADKANCYGLFGIHDTTVNTYDLFHKHYPNVSRFDGEHRLNDKVLKKVIVPLIKELTEGK